MQPQMPLSEAREKLKRTSIASSKRVSKDEREFAKAMLDALEEKEKREATHQ